MIPVDSEVNVLLSSIVRSEKFAINFLTSSMTIFGIDVGRRGMLREQVTHVPVNQRCGNQCMSGRQVVHRVDDKKPFHDDCRVESADDITDPISQPTTVRFANIHEGFYCITSSRQILHHLLVKVCILLDPAVAFDRRGQSGGILVRVSAISNSTFG